MGRILMVMVVSMDSPCRDSLNSQSYLNHRGMIGDTVDMTVCGVFVCCLHKRKKEGSFSEIQQCFISNAEWHREEKKELLKDYSVILPVNGSVQ